MTMSGELTKLKIKAYSDPKFRNEVGDGEFKTLLNPEKYSYKYKIEHSKKQAPGTSSSAPKFSKIPPEDLELDFVFDNTGVFRDQTSPQGSAVENIVSEIIKEVEADVMSNIEHFKKVVLTYNGKQHRPNYLVITWGALLFKGTLTEMTITYKLFKPDGTPLRALVHAKFKGFIEDKLRAAKENNTSPDLTHVRYVKEGDTLPLMTHCIYGDPKYYLEVAKANNLINFRKLKVGQKIFFPPLKKA
jgi:hypothetical protein